MPRSVTVEGLDGPITVLTLLVGVKRTIDLICALVAVYDRHRENVVADLPAEAITALDTLSAGCASFRALNPPGPA